MIKKRDRGIHPIVEGLIGIAPPTYVVGCAYEDEEGSIKTDSWTAYTEGSVSVDKLRAQALQSIITPLSALYSDNTAKALCLGLAIAFKYNGSPKIEARYGEVGFRVDCKITDEDRALLKAQGWQVELRGGNVSYCLFL